MMYIITRVSICIFLIGSVFSEVEIQCNNESTEKLDEALRELSVLGDPNGRYPMNETEFTTICQKDKRSLEWVQLYLNKCLSGLSLQVTTLTVKDMENVVKKYCDSPKLSKLYISWGRCGNSALNQTVKCWDQYILDVAKVNIEKARIPDDDLVALVCCDYYQFDQCVYESFHSTGSKECPTASAEGLHSILTEVSGRVLRYLCSEYQADNDKCDSLMTRYKYLKEIKLNKPLKKSPINALVQIMDNTPEVDKLTQRQD